MTTVFIISAPSGSGKSTLVKKVRDIVPNLEFSISYTTRNLRGAEENGREYYFISREEFEKMVRNDEFLEHAEVFGNYYGTARTFLRKAENDATDLRAPGTRHCGPSSRTLPGARRGFRKLLWHRAHV